MIPHDRLRNVLAETALKHMALERHEIARRSVLWALLGPVSSVDELDEPREAT